MDTNIIIVPSEKMDTNKKEGRNEHELVRMSKAARDRLDPNYLGIELEGPKSTKTLTTFKAFAEDVQEAKNLLDSDKLLKYDMRDVCFVSSNTFKQLGGTDKYLELVITDTFSKLLIGTDPELLIMHKGEVISADSIPGFSKEAKFGSDGAMAELRPTPAYSPEDLVKNIKQILGDDSIVNKVKDYDWVSTCYHETDQRDYPVGTHIHIDNPRKIASMSEEERLRLFAVTNKILDELLTLPLIRLDGEKGHNRRAKCKMSTHNGYNKGSYGKGYGFFGEWRSCNSHLEHRSLSGLVMLNPEICSAVFGTAKAITEAVYKEALRNDLDSSFILPKNFSKVGIYNEDFEAWEKIPLAASFECVTTSGIMNTTMNRSSREDVDVKFIKAWLNKIRQLPTYSNYEANIEALGDLLNSSSKVLDGFNANMKNTWKD